MPRYESSQPLPYLPGAPKSAHTLQVTIETDNPDVVERVKLLLIGSDLDTDAAGHLHATYVEVVRLGNGTAEHVWSSAYEPDDEQ